MERLERVIKLVAAVLAIPAAIATIYMAYMAWYQQFPTVRESNPRIALSPTEIIEPQVNSPTAKTGSIDRKPIEGNRASKTKLPRVEESSQTITYQAPTVSREVVWKPLTVNSPRPIILPGPQTGEFLQSIRLPGPQNPVSTSRRLSNHEVSTIFSQSQSQSQGAGGTQTQQQSIVAPTIFSQSQSQSQGVGGTQTQQQTIVVRHVP